MNVYEEGKKRGLSFLLLLVAVLAGWYLMQHFCAYVVLSGSMEPAIPTGSVVLIDTQKRDWKPGEVITYRRGTILVTHRIEWKTKDGYVTRGDANQEEDSGIVTKDQIKGSVAVVLPGIGYGIVWLQQRKALFFLLAFGIMFLILAHRARIQMITKKKTAEEK